MNCRYEYLAQKDALVTKAFSHDYPSPFKSSKIVVYFLQLLTLNRKLLTMLEVLTNGHNMPKRTFCNTSLNDILIDN